MFLLDTSAWIFILGPRPLPALRDRASDLILNNQAGTTPPVMFEILRGARNLHDAETLKRRLRSLHVYPFLESDWSEAAEWSSRLARCGCSVKSMDVLIAFKARQQNLTLIHADRDYDRIAKASSLKVESWVSRIP